MERLDWQTLQTKVSRHGPVVAVVPLGSHRGQDHVGIRGWWKRGILELADWSSWGSGVMGHAWLLGTPGHLQIAACLRAHSMASGTLDYSALATEEEESAMVCSS
jgi:hypothetical protein